MAYYSFVPQRQGTSYMGAGSGLGGWLGGMGASLVRGLGTGIDLNNALRNMQDNNAISPYAVSAAQMRLTQDRAGSALGLTETMGGLSRLIGRERLAANQMAGTTQPVSSASLAAAGGDPTAWSDDQLRNAMAQAFGNNVVSQNDPLSASGVNAASALLQLGRYSHNNPLGLSNWGQ